MEKQNMRQKIVDRALMFNKKEAHTNAVSDIRENYSEDIAQDDYVLGDGTINYPNNVSREYIRSKSK